MFSVRGIWACSKSNSYVLSRPPRTPRRTPVAVAAAAAVPIVLLLLLCFCCYCADVMYVVAAQQYA